VMVQRRGMNCVRMKIFLSPELRQLLDRNIDQPVLSPSGTAGFDRS